MLFLFCFLNKINPITKTKLKGDFMKKTFFCFLTFILTFTLVACGGVKTNAIELMGAGDRIHDSYTFANEGVVLSKENENAYTISGSVFGILEETVKEEFEIAENVTHVVAIKLTATESEVIKDEVEIVVNGSEAYDAEHLNGSNYTFIILEARAGNNVEIKVKWNSKDDFRVYNIKFADDLELK